MQVSSLHIDRFGPWSDLKLEDLSDGINVFHGPKDADQTLAHFVRAMLLGFSPETREHYIPAASRGAGGAVTITDRFGKQTIHRYDDGDHHGRLIIENADGSVVGKNRLQDIFAGVRQSAFDRVFATGLFTRRNITKLVDLAVAHGFDLEHRVGDPELLQTLERQISNARLRLAETENNDCSLPTLLDRQRSLEDRIENHRETNMKQLSLSREQLAHLESGIVDLERQLEELDEESEAIDARIEVLSEQRGRLYRGLRDAESKREQRLQKHRGKLREIDQQLERWREVAADMESRQQQLTNHSLADSTTGNAAAPDPRRVLRGVEAKIGGLQSALAEIEADTYNDCQCRELSGRFRGELQSLRHDINRLCDELSGWEIQHQAADTQSELAHLGRCESELHEAIRCLEQQRRTLSEEMEWIMLGGQAVFSDEIDCQCIDHPRPVDVADKSIAEDQQKLAELDAELKRLARQKSEIDDDRESLHAELADTRRRHQDLETELSKSRGLLDVQAWQADLLLVKRQIFESRRRAELIDEIARLEAKIHELKNQVHDSTIINEASAWLRQISDGAWQRIRIADDRTLIVADRGGKEVEHGRLGAAASDQLYLSFCMALVAAYRREGVRLPVIIDDFWAGREWDDVDRIARAILDFAARGHQVLVFTGRSQVAAIFRACHVPIRELPAMREAIVLPADPVDINQRLNAIADEEKAKHGQWSYNIGSSEEFPGELTDRVRKEADEDETEDEIAAEVEQSVIFDEDSDEYFLWDDSPIQEAPSIDAATAERLRKINVLVVGDLLNLDVADAAKHLRYAGITAEMIRRWRAEARLVCTVPLLRPYDARILVECGIDSAEQLGTMDAAELRDAVADFARTSRGQVIIRSGDRYELARLAEWIRSAKKSNRRQRREKKSSSDRGRTTKTRTANGSPQDKARRGQRSLNGATSKPRPQALVLKMDRNDSVQWQFYLNTADPVVDAPSIGPTTAQRLEAIGIVTVADLLNTDATLIAERLDRRRITTQKVRDWQLQSILVCRIPQLRGHDAQILVACGITEPDELAMTDPRELWKLVGPFVKSKEGKRILRNGKAPDLAEVTAWIQWAANARSLRAA